MIHHVHVITFVFAGGRSGRGRVRCQECGKQFADNYCLKRHMISHTGKAGSEYFPVYFAHFFQRSVVGCFHSHVFFLGEKKHTCDICGKKFAHSFHLTTHKKIHLGKRDFR